MLSSIIAAELQYLEGAVSGVNSWIKGPRDPFSIAAGDMPAATLAQSNMMLGFPRANQLDLTNNELVLSVYTASGTDIGEAETALQDLLLATDTSGGILRALTLAQGLNITVGSKNVEVFIRPQAQGAKTAKVSWLYGQRQSGGYLFGARIPLYVYTDVVIT